MSEANRIVYHADSSFESLEDILKFRLTYEGLLYGSFNQRTQGAHKHEIRRYLHPQLKQLWERSPLFKHVLIDQAPENRFFATEPRPFGLEELANRVKLGNYRYVSLVKEGFDLRCGINILFLRPGRAGTIFKSGDIDNRVKTILDALKCPRDLSGTEDASPVNGEDPFFCLLEDDGLVANFFS